MRNSFLQVLKAKANWEGEEKKGSWLHDDSSSQQNELLPSLPKSHPE